MPPGRFASPLALDRLVNAVLRWFSAFSHCLLSVVQIYALVVPLCTLMLGAVFAACGVYHRPWRHLLWTASAFALFSAGLAQQTMNSPADMAMNALVTGWVYLAAMVALARGMCLRFGVRFRAGLALLIMLVVWAGLYFYAVIEEDLMARIYILNFGVGAGLLLPSAQLVRVSWRTLHRLDQAVLGVYWLFGTGFFVRTLLTAPWSEPLSSHDFGSSLFWLSLNVSMLVFSLLFALLLLAATVLDMVDLLRRERNQDPLTGLLNRRGFEEGARMRLQRLRQGGAAVLFCDVDHFKQVNDRYGHAVGDDVLRHLGQLLRASVPPGDLLGRVGGEEFVALLSAMGQGRTVQVAQRIRRELQRLPLMVEGQPLRVSASFGVTRLQRGEDLQTAMQRADRLLYQAKALGRDCIVTDDGICSPDDPQAGQAASP